MSFSVGASDSPESIWNPSCTQKASGKHWRPRKPAESHCAAVRCRYPILAGILYPPKNGSSSPSALARILDLRAARVLLQPSDLLPPSWSNRQLLRNCIDLRSAEGRQHKFGRLIARYAMNGHNEQTSSLRWPPSVARKSGSCSKVSSSLEAIFVRRAAWAWPPKADEMHHVHRLAGNLRAAVRQTPFFVPERRSTLSAHQPAPRLFLDACPWRRGAERYLDLAAWELQGFCLYDGVMTHCITMRIMLISKQMSEELTAENFEQAR